MEIIPLSSIEVDNELQPRVVMDQAAIDDYSEAMKAGDTFPPITVFDDGKTKWLADGWHRYYAAEKAGRDEIEADIKQGSRRDALLFSISANTKHGLRSSRADKRRSVMTLLADSEWSTLSDRELAKLAGVTHPTIAKYRAEVEGGKFTTRARDSPLSAKVWEFFDGEGLLLFETFNDQSEYIREKLIVVADELEKTIDHMKECGTTDLWGDTWPFYNKGLIGASKMNSAGISYMIFLEPYPQPCHFWMEVYELEDRVWSDSEEEDDDTILVYDEREHSGTAIMHKNAITLDNVGLQLEIQRELYGRGARLSDFTELFTHDSDPSYIPPHRDKYPKLWNDWERKHYHDKLEERLLSEKCYPVEGGKLRAR